MVKNKKQTPEEFFKGDELAIAVWKSKYKLDIDEYPIDTFTRMAKEIYPQLNVRVNAILRDNDWSTLPQLDFLKGALEMQLDNFDLLVKQLSEFWILPGGSQVSGLGNPQAVSLSNCFVLGQPKDSYISVGITEIKKVELMKRRGGVGTDLSDIRPRGAKVNNSAKTSTGVVPFMEQFSDSTNRVAQDGRRGALMLSVSITHPDVMEVILAKRDPKKITGANISLMADDDFMRKATKYVEEGVDQDYYTVFPVTTNKNLLQLPEDAPYNKLITIKSLPGIYAKKHKISDLWSEFVKSNWLCADPGLLFKDAHDKFSPSHIYERYKNVSTNPCGEIMMGPEDSCRLVAAMVHLHVMNKFTPRSQFNYNSWMTYVFLSTLIADSVVDLEIEKIAIIKEKLKSDNLEELEYQILYDLWDKLEANGRDGRRLGVGLTGLGDAFAMMGLPYGNSEFLTAVMRGKFLSEWLASSFLAKSFGPFKEYDPKIDEKSMFFESAFDYKHNWGKFNELRDLVRGFLNTYGRRNNSVSTCAPNGTTSLISMTTSGIEPVYLFEYFRSKKVEDGESDFDRVDDLGIKWKEFKVKHPGYQTYLATPNKFDFNPYEGSEAHNLDPAKRVATQAIIQKYTSHSISSTVNLAKDIDPAVMSNIYLMAWKNGLKGITCYRDGSKGGVINKESLLTQVKYAKFVRPEVLPCKIIKVKIREKGSDVYEEWLAFFGIHEGRPIEIFTGKAISAFKIPEGAQEFEILKVKLDKFTNRYDFRYKDSEGFTVTVEGLSRCFNSAYYNYSKFTTQLLRNGLEIDHVINILKGMDLDDDINGWKSAVIRSLSKYVKSGTKTGDKCDNCGSDLTYSEGCVICRNCGASKCG